jgi:hypothetical protein
MRANRAFLGRAVRYLAADAGMRQFLDIGTGIPTAGNTHEIVQAIAPQSPPLRLVEEALLGQAVMGGNDGRVGRHDQECPPGNLLQVTAKTENETGDKVYNARGIGLLHVLQVDDDRDFLAIVITDGGGIPEVPRPHDRNVDTVTRVGLGTRDLIVAETLIEVLGKIPVLVGRGAIIKAAETEPITGAALHYADLRRYEPILGRRSGETTVGDGNRSEPDCTKL